MARGFWRVGLLQIGRHPGSHLGAQRMLCAACGVAADSTGD